LHTLICSLTRLWKFVFLFQIVGETKRNDLENRFTVPNDLESRFTLGFRQAGCYQIFCRMFGRSSHGKTDTNDLRVRGAYPSPNAPKCGKKTDASAVRTPFSGLRKIRRQCLRNRSPKEAPWSATRR